MTLQRHRLNKCSLLFYSGSKSKQCAVLHPNVFHHIACQYQQVIQVDDAWFNYRRYDCLGTSHMYRQSAYLAAFSLCNNKRSCTPTVKGWMSAKIIYHCKGKQKPNLIFKDNENCSKIHTSCLLPKQK